MKLLLPDTSEAAYRPPPNPTVLPTVLDPENAPRSFEEASREPNPDSPLGILAKYRLTLKPFQPKDLSKPPIPPPPPSKLSGYSPEELERYLDWVFELAETGGLDKTQPCILNAIEPEESYISAVNEALEALYPSIAARYESLQPKFNAVQTLRAQIRREIGAFLEFSSPEGVAAALHDGRKYARRLNDLNTQRVSLRHPGTWAIPFIRRMVEERLEECLEIFRFDDIEERHHVAINSVGDGKKEAPSFAFLPGTQEEGIEKVFTRISDLLMEAYEGTPHMLESRMRKISALRAKLYQLECKRTQDPIAAAAAKVASRTQQPSHSQPQPAGQIQI